jgi:ABC-type glycerol-3-phosphate transport system permease component
MGFLVFVCIVFFLFKLYPLLWGFCIVAHLKTKSVIYNFNSHWFIPGVFPSFYYLFYFISSHTHVCPHLLAEFTKSLTEQEDGKWYLYCTIYQLCCFFFNSNLFLTCFSNIFPQPPQSSAN